MNIGTLEATLGVNTSGLGTVRAEILRFQREANTAFDNINKKLDTVIAKKQTFEESMAGPLKKATKSGEDYIKTLDKIGRNVYYFGTASMRFMTLPLAIAGGAAMKMASDFEFSMQKIVGLVGVSQEQVNAWRKDVMKMGQEFGISSDKMAESLYFITSSGIPAAEAMGVLRDSAKASASGLGDMIDFSKTLTSAMSAYAASGLTSAQSTDILVKAIALGKAEGSDFARQIGDIIPIASKMGVGFDQIAAAMGAITLQGVPAAEAATFIKNALFKMLDVTPQSAKALETIGINAKKLRSIVANEGLLPAFKVLSEATKSYGTDAIAAILPNIRGFQAYLNLMGENMEYVDDVFKQVTNSTGSADAAWGVLSDTIKTKLNQAWVQVKNSMIEFFIVNKDQIIPVITQVAKAVQGIVGWYLNLGHTTRWLFNTMLILSATIGPLAISIGMLLRGVAGMAAVMKWATPIVKQFWITISANPMSALLIVLGALASGMLLASTQTKEATKAQKDFNDSVQKGVDIVDEMSSVENLMKVVTTMNQRQLSSFKDRISNQIALEEDYTTQMKAELTKQATSTLSSTEMERLLRKQALEGYVLTKEEETQINSRINADVLKSNMDYHVKNTAAYKNYLKTVENLIEASKKRKLGGNGGMSIEGTEAVIDIMKRVAAGERYISLATDVLGDAFKTASEKTSLYKGALGDLLKIEGVTATNQNVQTLVEKLGNVDLKAEQTSEIMNHLGSELLYLNNMNKLLGPSFDLNSEKLKAYDHVLEQLAKHEITEGEAVDLITQYRQKYAREVALSNQELQKSLALLALQNSIMFQGWDSTKLKQQTTTVSSTLDIYVKKLEQLQSYKVDNPLDTSVNSNFQAVTNTVKSLQVELDKLNAKQYTIDNLSGAFSNLTGTIRNVYAAADLMGEEIGGGLAKFASWVDLTVSIVTQLSALIKFLQALTIASKVQTGATLAQNTATGVQTAATIASTTSSTAAIAPTAALAVTQDSLALAYSNVAVAGALAAAAWIPFPGNIPAMGASMTALLTTMATGKAATYAAFAVGLADGGVVPAGYPNDTYPALLSSNETVVPAGKFPSFSSMNGDFEVKFEIDGYSLVAILNKYTKKLNKV